MTNPAATLGAILAAWSTSTKTTSPFRDTRSLHTETGLEQHFAALKALIEIRTALDSLAADGEDVGHLESSLRAWVRMVFGSEINWGAQANSVKVESLYPPSELGALKSLRMTLNQGRRVPRADWSEAWRARIAKLEELLDQDDSLQPWLREHMRSLIDELRALLDSDATEADMQTTLRNTATAMREAEAQSSQMGDAWRWVRDELATPIGLHMAIEAFTQAPGIGT